jgi:hypothetical protein
VLRVQQVLPVLKELRVQHKVLLDLQGLKVHKVLKGRIVLLVVLQDHKVLKGQQVIQVLKVQTLVHRESQVQPEHKVPKDPQPLPDHKVFKEIKVLKET